MSIVKIQRKGQMTLPTGVRAAVGLADGDLVDVKVAGRKIVVTPMLVIDGSKFPAADDDYTPEQRRIIDARLAEGLADIKAGRVYGPFATHEQLMKSLRGRGKKAKAKTRKRAFR